MKHIPPELTAALDIYKNKTGFEYFISDPDGNPCSEKSCPVKCTEKCPLFFKKIIEESIRWNGTFIYLCPEDHIVWASPVFINERYWGGVISGFKSPEDSDAPDTISAETAQRCSNFLLETIINAGFADKNIIKAAGKYNTAQREIAESIHEKKARQETGNALYNSQDKLIRSVRLYEVNEIKGALNDVLGEIYLEAINNITLLKFRMLELFVLISRNMISIGADPEIYYRLTMDYCRNAEISTDIYSFSVWLKDILEAFTAEVLKKRFGTGKISRALEYIKEHIESDPGPADIAKHIALSESWFTHLFRQETGHSPAAFIQMYKIEKAKEIINRGRHNLAETAAMLNFYDQSHFIRTFKKYAGITPSAYMKKSRNVQKNSRKIQ
ncbi:MAG TPA: hypothetical protein DC049_16635 [Spirochaetia bacterium]|nr:hypothetical protein [Spirochaetia bacterium]